MGEQTTAMLSQRTVSRAGVDLAVFEGGNVHGPTLVLVHGWPDTHHMWSAVMELLADEFHVVAYDTRGQGQSGTGAPDVAFDLAELANDFFAVVEAVSPSSPVHVLAHDWGSIQVWEAVCEAGAEERVASFTSMSGPNLDHLAAWLRRRLSRPTPRGIAEVLAQVVASSYVGFLVSPLAPPVLGALADRDRWRRLLSLAEGRPPAAGGHADSLPRDMVSGLRYYRANLLRSGGRPRERSTTVPVLQLVLTRDPAVRPAALDESQRWVQHLERRSLPLGHWAALTHPETVAEEAAGFVRAVESRTRD